MIGTIDRRKVVILFSVLLTLSCLLVSFAESFTLLLLGRACLGLGLGGFWAMSASLTMRPVPARTVPKALSVIFGAVSIALVIAAPLGSFLGGIIGWRNVFNAAAVMGLLCIIWVWKALPSLPGEAAHHKQNMFALLKRSGVLAGMTAIFMAFAGQFAFFTYIRPVFMTMAGFDVDGLTLVLLSFGIASFVGTSLSSQFLKRSLKVALAGAPLVLAASAAVLVLWGSDKWVASAIAIIWGFAFALVPVGWSTWITRSLADQAEKAGSIQVAVIQLANTCGAAIGGVALDHLGLTSPLVISGTLMLLTALLVAGRLKRSSVFSLSRGRGLGEGIRLRRCLNPSTRIHRNQYHRRHNQQRPQPVRQGERHAQQHHRQQRAAQRLSAAQDARLRPADHLCAFQIQAERQRGANHHR